MVVIPSFRAETTLEHTINGIGNEVDNIIIVNDASPDRTIEVVKSIEDKRITLLEHKRNFGVGVAMKTGIAKALEEGADIVIKMDADNQMDPKYIPDLIVEIKSGRIDCCKGSRWQYGINRNNIPKLRLWGNTVLTFLTRLATGYWQLSDPNNGYIAWSRGILKRIDWNQVHDRFFFETSMLVQLNLLNATVVDIPMEPRYLGERSTLNPLKAIPEFGWNLFLYGVKRWWQKYFLYDMTAVSIFLIFGGLLVIFGGSWGFYQWRWHAIKSIVTPTGTVMIAVLPLLVGIILLIQALVLDITESKQK